MPSQNGNKKNKKLRLCKSKVRLKNKTVDRAKTNDIVGCHVCNE